MHVCKAAKWPCNREELPGFPKLQSHQCHQAPTGQLVSRQPRASGRGGVYIMLVYVIVEGGSSPATRPHVSRARPGRQAFLAVMECRVCLGDHVLLGSKGFPCPQIMQCGHGMVCMHLKRAGASKRGRCAVGVKIRSMPHICPSRALPCMPASIASLRLVFSLFFFQKPSQPVLDGSGDTLRSSSLPFRTAGRTASTLRPQMGWIMGATLSSRRLSVSPTNSGC